LSSGCVIIIEEEKERGKKNEKIGHNKRSYYQINIYICYPSYLDDLGATSV
jgi:hypothetical protein